MPHLEALLLEIQRFCTIVPKAIPHYTKTATTVKGYDIPDNTFVIFNLHAVHRCQDTFDDADVFRPERFLTLDGRFERHPHVIPFGLGKRSCLGELLATQEVFLFTAALIQNFKFKRENEMKLSEDGVMGFTLGPKAFKVKAIPREM